MKMQIGDTVLISQNEMTNMDAIAIERETGLTLKELGEGLRKASAIATTAMLWLTRRKAGERQLRFDDVVFSLGDVKAVADDGGELVPAVDDDGQPVKDADGDTVMVRADGGELLDPKAPESTSSE